MKVLVIGSGGREHAICRSFANSLRLSKLYCANGNAGIAEIAECVEIHPADIASLTSFSLANKIDLTFVGGETTLALGIVDEFEKHGLNIIGPSKAATELEASKAFAKDFMARHGIPTAKYTVAHSPEFAIAELESGDFGNDQAPVVVKADGLAAGKGVVVASDRSEAINSIRSLGNIVGTDAAKKIVLEERLVGKEVSLLMFADGEQFALMPPVRDHKRIGEGDTGLNTGGMGTFTDPSLLSSDQLEVIVKTIIHPTLHGCIREGFPFRGILFLGLMMTAAGPKLLEYNVRFGDPETQSILIRLETDIIEICESMLAGRLSQLSVQWKQGSSACIVLAASGYPGKPVTGEKITGLESLLVDKHVTVFHAGTARRVSPDGTPEFLTAGGRVLGIASLGENLDQALTNAYQGVSKINFSGMQFRRDIGRTI